MYKGSTKENKLKYKEYYHNEKGFLYTSNASQAVNCGSCLSPPVVRLPPVKSMETRDVTTSPPPLPPLPAFFMALRIEVRMVPYVAPGPERSTAWMKQNVMAPVDVIFDSADVSAEV